MVVLKVTHNGFQHFSERLLWWINATSRDLGFDVKIRHLARFTPIFNSMVVLKVTHNSFQHFSERLLGWINATSGV